MMSKNLNINKIKIIGEDSVDCDYPYSLNDENWKEMQIKKLKAGYESRSLR